MEIINLKEMYSNYYIRNWKKQGLKLITERPATTTSELLEEFFRNKEEKKNKRKIIKIKPSTKKLDWRDFVREDLR